MGFKGQVFVSHYFGFEFSESAQELLSTAVRGQEQTAIDAFSAHGGVTTSDFANLLSVLIAVQAYDLASVIGKAQHSAYPKNTDAIYWYALAEVYCKRPDDAIGIAGDGLKTVGQQPQLYLVVGLAMLSVGSLQNAGKTLQTAHSKNAGPIALAYIGEVLRLMGRLEQAVACHQQCLNAGCTDAEAYYLAGSAFYDHGQVDQAISLYDKAIQQKPYYLDAHDALNKALWEHGHRFQFIKSFDKAISAFPDLLALRLRQAHFRIMAGDLEAAANQLEANHGEFGDNARLLAELANVKKQMDDTFDALPLYEKAYAADANEKSVTKSYGRALIADARYREASAVLSGLKTHDDFDQECLAFLATCQEHIAPDQARRVNDYDGLVRVYDLTAPKGYASMDAFNVALLSALQPLHRTDAAPLEQTLVRGTQTHGMLFNSAKPEIKQLVSGLELCVQKYIDHLRSEGPPEMRDRISNGFEFSGAWSVQLSAEGYHVDHVHSAGWISSVYYVEVPDDLDSENHEGWLKFGDTPFDPNNTGPKRFVQPKPGRLVLFPSYMLHGTVPIREGKRRTTVAFDVVPR